MTNWHNTPSGFIISWQCVNLDNERMMLPSVLNIPFPSITEKTKIYINMSFRLKPAWYWNLRSHIPSPPSMGLRYLVHNP